MKEIKLTQGKTVVVDAGTFKWASKFKWYVNKSGRNHYAVRDQWLDGKRRTIFLHREIIGAKDGEFVDHIDGNSRNNLKKNLRIATTAQNVRNQRKQLGTSSRFKGVYWNKRRQKWHAQIKFQQRRVYLGLFSDQEDAARAYDTAARERFGEFAALNFP